MTNILYLMLPHFLFIFPTIPLTRQNPTNLYSLLENILQRVTKPANRFNMNGSREPDADRVLKAEAGWPAAGRRPN